MSLSSFRSSPESTSTPSRTRKSLRRTGSDSPTTMLKTISEVPTANLDDSATEQHDCSEEDPLHSEGAVSSTSTRSEESGIDVTDGFLKLGGKKQSKKVTSPAAELQNGNQSPGIGMEHAMTSTPRDPKIKSKLELSNSPSPLRDSDSLTRSAEWMHCESYVPCTCMVMSLTDHSFLVTGHIFNWCQR